MRVSALTLLLVLVLPFTSIGAAPIAYSVNSDSPDANFADHLYSIDLATGVATRIGEVRALEPNINSDIEGLAFDTNGRLFGADDADETLLTLNLGSGQATSVNGSTFNLQLSQANYDFGLTFTCDGSLLMVADQPRSLFEVDDAIGQSTLRGVNGSLAAPISGIAAFGDLVYGIGQGSDDGVTPLSPNLYLIDPVTGTASLIGPLGNAVSPYRDAGLAFDSSGGLWAITDRRDINAQDLASQVLSINTATGEASLVSEIPVTDGAVGFESLAIAAPAGCSRPPNTFGVNPEGVPSLDQWALLLLIMLLGGIGFRRLRQPT